MPSSPLPSSPSSAARSVMKLAVGVDGSTASKAALRWARTLITSVGADVTVVHAWDRPPRENIADGSVGQVGSLSAQAQGSRRAQMLVDRTLQSVGVDTSSDAVRVELSERGPRAELMLQSSESDLVVVGRKPSSRLSDMLLGSTTSWLVRHSHGPLAVVPASFHPDRHLTHVAPRVIVGYDGSADALRALRWTIDHLSADPIIVHVFDPRQVRDLGPNHDTLDCGREDAMREVDASLAAAGIPAELTRVFCEGRPGTVLAAADGADVVVVGPGALDRFAELGSVAAHTARHAPVPVIIVR